MRKSGHGALPGNVRHRVRTGEDLKKVKLFKVFRSQVSPIYDVIHSALTEFPPSAAKARNNAYALDVEATLFYF